MGGLDEQRTSERIQVQDTTFAVLKGGPITLCKVLDISQGGLAFSHLPSEELPERLCNLEILLPDRSFHLKDVPIKAIYDAEMSHKLSYCFQKVKPRKRCGVQFGELTDKQKTALEFFIRAHTKAQG